jgi:alkylation response protein AidB-like acyl-CoA dehydrogenase
MGNDPLAKAQNLRDLILANRDETESQRRLAEPIVQALVESGLCRMALPAENGGLQTSPVDALAVYETLAAAEASVAWIVWNNSLVCWFARFLSPAARREIFGDPTRLYASSTRPTGKAAAAGDGTYRVNGRWSLVSGCMHAHWIPVMCLIEEDGEVQMLMPGVPKMRLFFVPRERFEILDTWHVGGLRGTGSHDAVLADEPASEERSVFFMDESRLDSPFGRAPITVTMSAGCASICVGIAQAAVDALIALGRTKVSVDPVPGLRDRPSNQLTVAKTATMLGALRANLRASYGELWNKVESGDAPTAEDLAEVWSASVTAALECRSAVTAMYAAAGARALYVDNPIERAHRDIHAVLQHIVLQPLWLEEAGRVKLGLEPTSPLFSI